MGTASFKFVLLLSTFAVLVTGCGEVEFADIPRDPALSSEVPPGEIPPNEIPPGEEPPTEVPPVTPPPVTPPPVTPPPVTPPPVTPPPVTPPPVTPPPVTPPPVTPPPVTPPPVTPPPVTPPRTGVNQEQFEQNSPSATATKILMINDSSYSMRTDRFDYKFTFANFLNSISATNWEMAFTTSTIGFHGLEGSLYTESPNRYMSLNQNSSNLQSKFIDTMDLYYCEEEDEYGFGMVGGHPRRREACANGSERPLTALKKALNKSHGNNAPFLKDHLNLHVVIVSDSDEIAVSPDQATTTAEVIKAFNDNFSDDSRLTVHGIIVPPGDSSCLAEQRYLFPRNSDYGTKISDLIQATQGSTTSICAPTFTNTARAITGNSSSIHLWGEVQLQHTPISESVRVQLSPAQNISWTVQGDKIIFSVPPQAGTTVSVAYEFLLD